jgi:hypothetical protein
MSPRSPGSTAFPQKRPFLAEAESEKGSQENTPHRPVGVRCLERRGGGKPPAGECHGDQIMKQTHRRMIHQTAIGRIVRDPSSAKGPGQLADQLSL